jgi:hypothetical protein
MHEVAGSIPAFSTPNSFAKIPHLSNSRTNARYRIVGEVNKAVEKQNQGLTTEAYTEIIFC